MKLFFLLAPLFLSSPATEKVLICSSPTSYAYHNKLCRGLAACTHEIDTVSLATAIEKGKTKRCGNCYK